MARDISQISERFLTQAEFVAPPSIPTQPERPTPLMYIATFAILFALIAVVYQWQTLARKLMRNLAAN